MDAGIAEILEGTDSIHHRRFVAACATHGLSMNIARRLIGSFQGTLQGGELLGRDGLSPSRGICRGLGIHPERLE